MGVGDFVGGPPGWGGGGGGGGGGLRGNAGGFSGLGGFFANTGSLGGAVGGALGGQQSVNPMPSGGLTGQYVPPGIGADGTFQGGGMQYQTQPPPAAQPPRDWYDTYGATTAGAYGTSPTAPTRDPDRVLGSSTGALGPSQAAIAQGDLAAQIGLLGLNYQRDVNYATQDNGLNQQMLELRKKLLGLDAGDIGTDKASILNRKGGLGRDSDFLRQQRGMYDQQLANQLAQIDTRYALDKLDHENQYVSGGAWFAPGQQYRANKLSDAAEQNREAARLGTAMSQLGIDRSLNSNDTQSREYDFDMQKLDSRLSANGINLQMLGLNQQQLGLALQKRIEDLGLGAVIDANKLLDSAAQGGSQQSDYALNMIFEWLKSGAIGPIPNVTF